MYEHILVPTDGSSGTAQALAHALAIATAHDSTIHVLYVYDKRHYMAAPEETTAEIRRSLDEEAERAIDDARIRIEEEGVSCLTSTEEGIPHKSIVEYATGEDIDLIVMGTHGKTGREQIVTLGSTTERVVKNGSVPVLVVELD